MELETANAGAEAPASESLSPAPSTPAPETNASPEPTVTTDVTLDDDLRAVYQKSTATRDRDDSGRFVSKEPGEAETPAAPVTDQNPEAERIEQAKPAIEPPVSWSRETREKWAALPPDLQEFISKRESDAHAQITRLGQTAKAAEPLLQVVEQNRELFAKRNLSPDQGISALLNAQRRLDENPVAAIGWLASQYGVDLSAFANPDGTASAQNPVVMSLQHEIAALKRELAETSSTVKQTQAERQATELAKYQGAVNAFLEGKNLTEADEAELVVLVNAEKQLNPEKSPDQLLKDAYETFLYRSPERREKTMREKLAAEQARQAEEAKKKAAEAKKLAGLNVRSHPASSANATTMDDTLRDAYRRAQSR
jgi:hypothetical protein